MTNKTKFHGSYSELKSKIKFKGKWRDLSDTLKQFKSESGLVINWYSNTKTFYFQGNQIDNEINKVFEWLGINRPLAKTFGLYKEKRDKLQEEKEKKLKKNIEKYDSDEVPW